MQINKKLWWSLCKCANERHRNDFIKYITPWWFENNLLTRCVSCSVRSPVSRPSPKLASSRLRQRLLGAAASQTSRRKPCYRQSDLFSNSSWLYYFMHYILQCSSSAHCQKLLAWPLFLKRNAMILKTMAVQKCTAMCKMNNSQEGTFTCPSGNSFICTCNTVHL